MAPLGKVEEIELSHGRGGGTVQAMKPLDLAQLLNAPSGVRGR